MPEYTVTDAKIEAERRLLVIAMMARVTRVKDYCQDLVDEDGLLSREDYHDFSETLKDMSRRTIRINFINRIIRKRKENRDG